MRNQPYIRYAITREPWLTCCLRVAQVGGDRRRTLTHNDATVLYMDVREGIHEVFLCYKWEDAEAARALRGALISCGLNVFLDAINGPIWAPLSDSIRDALRRSRTLVALITPRFPVSPHCREELHTALLAAYHLDGDTSARVMAVAQGVSPDDVEPYRLRWARLPMHGTPQDELVATIVANVEAHEGVFGDAPSPPRPRWFPAERTTGPFGGRFAEVWRLHHALRSRVRAADGGPPVVVINGPGGVGKTALARQFAKLFAQDHPGGVFILELGEAMAGRLPETLGSRPEWSNSGGSSPSVWGCMTRAGWNPRSTHETWTTCGSWTICRR